jgi:hypothetical protein
VADPKEKENKEEDAGELLPPVTKTAEETAKELADAEKASTETE